MLTEGKSQVDELGSKLRWTKVRAWLDQIQEQILKPRAEEIRNHPFVLSVLSGQARREDAVHYFAGLMWHLIDFDKHVAHLHKKRPASIDDFLKERSEDKDGNTDILGRIVKEFGGPFETLVQSPWAYRPHPVWVNHDALLRSAIYSTDLSWEVGVAALNVGIESLVPTMIEPLFEGCTKNYGLSRWSAQWLESRSQEEERQHGENGFLILERYLDPDNQKVLKTCECYIDALSRSMATQLLKSGLPH